MGKGVCSWFLLNRIIVFSVHFVWWILLPDLDYSRTDGEPKLCTVEHTSEATDEKGALILPLFCLYFAFRLVFSDFAFFVFFQTMVCQSREH